MNLALNTKVFTVHYPFDLISIEVNLLTQSENKEPIAELSASFLSLIVALKLGTEKCPKNRSTLILCQM